MTDYAFYNCNSNAAVSTGTFFNAVYQFDISIARVHNTLRKAAMVPSSHLCCEQVF